MTTSRWLTVFGGALAVLLVVAHVIPVGDCFIELQPDGKSLGRIPAEDVRVGAIAIASIPLAFAAIFVVFAKRKRPKVAWLCVSSALVVAVLMLSYVLHTMRN
jgi:hypothetical protein